MSNVGSGLTERDIYIPLLDKIAGAGGVLITVGIVGLYKLLTEANHVEAVALLATAGASVIVTFSYLVSQPLDLAGKSGRSVKVLAFVSNILMMLPAALAAYMIFYKGLFSLLHLVAGFSVAALFRSAAWLVLGLVLIKNIEKSTAVVRTFSNLRNSAK